MKHLFTWITDITGAQERQPTPANPTERCLRKAWAESTRTSTEICRALAEETPPSLCIISITEGCTDTTRQALTTSFDIDIHNALVLLGMQAKVKGIMTVTWHIHWGAGFTLNGFMKN